MNIKIKPSILKGNINIIGDKSFSHRAIICACIAKGKSIIKNVNMCQDVKNTINILREIVPITIEGTTVTIDGGFDKIKKQYIDIKESGSTARFLMPILSYLSENELTFCLGDKLLTRPFDEYERINKENDKTSFVFTNNSIITKGFCDKEEYYVSIKKSSQFVSGLLFLTTKLKHNTTIIIDEDEENYGYIDLTISVFKMFDFNVKREGNKIFVIYNQILKPAEITVPSDASFLVFSEMLKQLNKGVDYDVCLNENIPDYSLYQKIKNKTLFDEEIINLNDNPDCFSLVCLYTAIASKSVKSINIPSRLIYKESDRLNNTISLLENMNVDFETKENTIVIHPSKIDFEQTDTFKDHRFVFCSVLASSVVEKDILIKGVECVNKSHPSFLQDIKNIGFVFEKIIDVEKLNYTISDKNTKILISKNLTKEILIETKKHNKVVLVTEKNIPIKYYENILNKANVLPYICECSSTEKIKTLKEVERLVCFLLENNIQKSDLIIGFGGGTILDFVSYVSMVYKRGIDFVSVPTTLVSQIDAAIGGKNAINIENNKNAVGGFYTPSSVFVSTEFLNSLDDKEFKNGIAEMIKIFSLVDFNNFYEMYDLNNKKENINRLVCEAIKRKIEFVLVDPFDKKERQALNFGHTIGHAIELSEQISHGEAVAQGMFIESDNKQLHECLIKNNFKKNNKIKIDKTILNDKKIKDNTISMVELKEIGHYKLVKKNINEILW